MKPLVWAVVLLGWAVGAGVAAEPAPSVVHGGGGSTLIRAWRVPVLLGDEAKKKGGSGSPEEEAGASISPRLMSPVVGAYLMQFRSEMVQAWPRHAQAIPAGTPPGRVVMRVRLKRDGGVEDIECIEGREDHPVVAAAAKSCLKGLNGKMKPFSSELRAIVGSVMTEHVVFFHL